MDLAADDVTQNNLLVIANKRVPYLIVLALVEQFSWGGGTSPPPEGWPAPAPRDSELGLPLQID